MKLPLIAVTGAAGKTGRATALALLERGQRVRALVRREDARSDTLARAGAEVVVANLHDAQSMATALHGTQRAYYCPPIDPYAAVALNAFLYAARSVGLEAVTAMTQWLASPSHPTQMTRDMWMIERLLPALPGTAVTILNPGFFADNYLRVGLGMAVQLGIYPNFVGDSRNAPPSNDDMGRVAAAVLADPTPHAGRRYRVTGPALIDADDIVAVLARVFERRVRRLDAPEWLLGKVAAYRGEPRYDIAVFRRYLRDHREGAFEFGGPTDVVRDLTGAPAEPFERTVLGYASRPESMRTWRAFARSAAEFMLAPLWKGYDDERLARTLGLPRIAHPLHAMQDEAWKADRGVQSSQVHAAFEVVAA